MTRLLKFTSIVLVTFSAVPFATTSADAVSVAVRQSCRQQAARIWPPNTGDIAQYNRNRRDLVRACINNGGKIPG